MKKIIVTIGFAIAAMFFASANANAAEVQVNNTATEELAVDAEEITVLIVIFDDGSILIVVVE